VVSIKEEGSEGHPHGTNAEQRAMRNSMALTGGGDDDDGDVIYLVRKTLRDRGDPSSCRPIYSSEEARAHATRGGDSEGLVSIKEEGSEGHPHGTNAEHWPCSYIVNVPLK
jgi:hypothetical protein